MGEGDDALGHGDPDCDASRRFNMKTNSNFGLLGRV